ncbi:MAG: GNAT family N-acetyltransferase [Deltaproteobacteria bacterium]|nr:GNAT family N-acetyltransferase [Deltaproteobacteria bacterium]
MNEKLIVIFPASDDDYEFSYQVKKAAEGELISNTFGWNEGFQRAFHKEDWKEKRPNIIKFDSEKIGTNAITEGDGFIEIGQFFILPEHQSRGVGSYILDLVLQQADGRGLVAQLALLRGNRAESLYIRKGFVYVRQTETYCYMERKPRPPGGGYPIKYP